MPGGVEGKLENQKQANGLKNSMSSFYEYCQCFRFWRRKKIYKEEEGFRVWDRGIGNARKWDMRDLKGG